MTQPMPTDAPARPTDDRDALLGEAARALLAAERDRRPIAPLSRTIADLTEAEAYRIARIRVLAGSARRIGYKLGYTSAAMRAQMGIADPNYGALLAGCAIEDGGRVAAGTLIHPRVEPEVALLIGRELAGTGVTRDTAWAAVDKVMPSLEIVDTRYESYVFTAVDNIADNSSAARHVLGPALDRKQSPDLGAVAVRLLRDGRQIDPGRGSDAMGDPILALVWLAGALARSGTPIKAGEIVLTGGLTRAHPAPAGSDYRAIFDGLGTVSVEF